VGNQELINILFGLLSILGGWVLKTIWDAVRDLQKADTQLTKEISEVKTLVAGNYVEKEYFEAKVDAMFLKLDGIRDRLDMKADKHN